MTKPILAGALLCAIPAMPAQAQDHDYTATPADTAEMTADDHAAMGHDMAGGSTGPRDGSGTSRLPGSGGHHGLHIPAGDWTLMVHGQLFTPYSDQGGPRGDG